MFTGSSCFYLFFVLSHRNVISAEKTPLVKKQNEEPIPKERRALLWFNSQPHDKVVSCFLFLTYLLTYCLYVVPLLRRISTLPFPAVAHAASHRFPRGSCRTGPERPCVGPQNKQSQEA